MFICWFVCVPAAAVVAGWFQQCVFLWSDWSAPPPSAELTDETEHPSVCPPTGSSYHSKDREREMERNIILHISLCTKYYIAETISWQLPVGISWLLLAQLSTIQWLCWYLCSICQLNSQLGARWCTELVPLCRISSAAYSNPLWL